jgi:hypothetical protein
LYNTIQNDHGEKATAKRFPKTRTLFAASAAAADVYGCVAVGLA